MKSRNQYRRHHREQQAASANVRLLEAALSIKDRLFSIVALRRGLRRLRRWGIILLIVLPLLAALFWGGKAAVEKAYSLSMDKVSFDARQNLISKEQAMEILGIEGAINMATLDTTAMQKKLEENNRETMGK
jgi:cell division septal protein FtsQ